jgi:hypothetical protein
VTAFDRVTPAPLEVRLTILAVTVPPVFVRLPEEVRDTVPIVPAPACKLPLTFNVPALTFNENVDPFPAEEALRLTAAAVSFPMLTLPVEWRPRVEAFRVKAPA